jgi:hypothetical protein
LISLISGCNLKLQQYNCFEPELKHFQHQVSLKLKQVLVNNYCDVFKISSASFILSFWFCSVIKLFSEFELLHFLVYDPEASDVSLISSSIVRRATSACLYFYGTKSKVKLEFESFRPIAAKSDSIRHDGLAEQGI